MNPQTGKAHGRAARRNGSKAHGRAARGDDGDDKTIDKGGGGIDGEHVCGAPGNVVVSTSALERSAVAGEAGILTDAGEHDRLVCPHAWAQQVGDQALGTNAEPDLLLHIAAAHDATADVLVGKVGLQRILGVLDAPREPHLQRPQRQVAGNPVGDADRLRGGGWQYLYEGFLV